MKAIIICIFFLVLYVSCIEQNTTLRLLDIIKAAPTNKAKIKVSPTAYDGKCSSCLAFGFSYCGSTGKCYYEF
jgi:hypothetical protein